MQVISSMKIDFAIVSTSLILENDKHKLEGRISFWS